MGRTNLDQTYVEAFHAAIAQREQIYKDFEMLKVRRTLVETAARTLEPLVYPDEYRDDQEEQASKPSVAMPTVVEISRSMPNPEITSPVLPVEAPVPVPVAEPGPAARPVQALTQVYVRGDGEPDEEIQRRISIAIGRSAAD